MQYKFESDFTITGPQNYGPHFTRARIAKMKLTPAKAVNIHDIGPYVCFIVLQHTRCL